MAKNNEKVSPDRSLPLAIVIVGIFIIGGGTGLSLLFTLPETKDITVGFTNIAMVGGVAGGLSLTGTTILTLNSRFLRHLVSDFGIYIRSVLFGGYCAMTVAAVACGITAIYASQPWSRWVLGYSTALVVVGVTVTAMLINSAFVLHLRATTEPQKKASAAAGKYAE
ncbi:hypothetical protein [Arthrobacter psychrochitiniphilus]|uniref:hypothetical protein n=1 Tax=Arthrobacter psychrochitiniphilus TaxID=291045 RepID=UPI003F7C86CD